MEGRASSQAIQQDSEDKWKGVLQAKQFSRIVRINDRKGALPANQFIRIVRINARARF